MHFNWLGNHSYPHKSQREFKSKQESIFLIQTNRAKSSLTLLIMAWKNWVSTFTLPNPNNASPQRLICLKKRRDKPRPKTYAKCGEERLRWDSENGMMGWALQKFFCQRILHKKNWMPIADCRVVLKMRVGSKNNLSPTFLLISKWVLPPTWSTWANCLTTIF